MQQHLLIFIKNPIEGKVKSRIAATLGTQKALAIYEQLLLITQEASLQLKVYRDLFYSDFIDNQDTWSEEDFQKYLQSSGDLGNKMLNAFQTVFAQGASSAVIIGSDCPTITSEILQMAFNQLLINDVVIGEAEDGGYYLLGMNKLYPQFFENKEWSTENVSRQTIEDCKQLQLKYCKLPILADIDTEADWIKYLKENAKKY